MIRAPLVAAARARAVIDQGSQNPRGAGAAPAACPGVPRGAVRVLGVDPGSQATGFGVIECDGRRLVHVAHGTIRPQRAASLAGRLHGLQQALSEVIERHRPDVASVEQVFVASGARSALVLGQARGALLAALGASGVALREYAPARIKQAVTGSGRAPKAQVQRMVRRLLALEASPAPDASDALAAAICHAHNHRLSALGVQAQRRPRPRRSRGLQVRRAP